MKDRRPPGKGGPQRGPKGGAPSRFRKDAGQKGGFSGGSGGRGARGPRSGAGQDGEARRFDGPRRPREAKPDGERRFDRSTERSFDRDGAGDGRRFQAKKGPPRGRGFGGDREERSADDRGSRGPRRWERGAEDSGDAGARFERRPRRQDGDREGDFATEGRRPRGFRPDRAERGSDGADGGKPARRFERGRGENDRFARDRSGGDRPFEKRTASGPREGRRFDRDHDRDERPRRDDAEPRAPFRKEKPRPGAEQRIAGRDKARRAHSIGEDGALWLYGKHAVAAALANPARKIKRLLAAEGALAFLAAAGVDKDRIAAAEETSTDEIDLLLHQGAVHQGLAALVEDLPRARLREECAPDDKGGPVVVLDQITDPQNIGAIMRSAAAFGAKAVIVQDRRTPPLAGALAKAAAGAVELIPCVKVVNVARAVEGLKDLGYYCAGLAGEATAPIGDIPKGRPVALVLGAEGEGLRRLVAETCDGLYHIPIEGAVDSLNVSTAGAVSLFSVTRG